MRLAATLAAAAVALALVGCERSQADAARLTKADTRASQGAVPAYTAAGWTAGDEASWQQQIRARTQGQNEYVRIPASRMGGSPVPAVPATAAATQAAPAAPAASAGG